MMLQQGQTFLLSIKQVIDQQKLYDRVKQDKRQTITTLVENIENNNYYQH